MRRVIPGFLSLVLVGLSAECAGAEPSDLRGKTIKDLSGSIPLETFQRSVGPKFYRSLLVSPLADWSAVRARITGDRLAAPQVIRPAANRAYDSLALQFARDTTLVARDRGGRNRPAASAQMHLLVYKIADGFMAVSFAFPEATPGQQHTQLGTVRLSIQKAGGSWTELPSSGQDERGRRLRRIDRMPMDIITSPAR